MCLVYLHLSAWGVKGPNSNSPGFDIGAFWASTGMTGAFQDPGKYRYSSPKAILANLPIFSSYPMAFGDRIASMNLVSAVSLGLSHRQLNGMHHQPSSRPVLVAITFSCARTDFVNREGTLS